MRKLLSILMALALLTAPALAQTGCVIPGATTVPETTSWSPLAADTGKVYWANCASACTLTLPSTPPTAVWRILVEVVGAGTVTVSSGATINGATAYTTWHNFLVSTDGTAYYVGAAGVVDQADVKIIPAANCVNAVAAAAWNTSLTPACIGGSNNLGGYLPFVDASTAMFAFELRGDWDTTIQPFVKISFQSNTNTSGTVIFNVAVACFKGDGSITSDPAFNTADALATKTMAAATRGWDTTGQLTQVTSGNNCVPGGTMIVKVTRATDTASAAVWVTKAVITTAYNSIIQAN